MIKSSLLRCSLLFSATAVGQAVDFNREIRPILSANCYACHGPEDKGRKADLRLDHFEGATADLGGYAALVPGDPGASELIRRVESDDPDEWMPPPKTGHTLTGDDKGMLRAWITGGGEYDEHWAFTAPEKVALPEVADVDWPNNAIDHFILARIEQAKLAPSSPADPYRLLRRLSLDLTGLPPTIEQAEAFAADPSVAAYEAAVERLLASGEFGEHWARMWLDLARYADTKGYEKDRPRTIWRFRDWVIDAFNKDMPYDEFTLQQLAGDLLADATTDQILATAFHRNTMVNEEGGTDDEEFRVAAVKDRVDTTLQVWMGLTMGCAKCHSHKYDPISITDYYSTYAIFNQTQDRDRGDDSPTLRTPTAEQVAGRAGLDEKALAAHEKTFPTTPVMRELPEDKRRTTAIHLRGNFLDQAKEPVAPGVPSAFGTLPPDVSADRAAVARWLCSDDNPLTARVMVNRIWARLFGVGMVETEEDFGSQGSYPSHPELLDWLAVDYREGGWSLKGLLRTIVASATYQQSSVVTGDRLAADPRNRLLARGARFRLSAETVRDQSLAASGLLTRKIGGPSVFPPQPPNVWKSTYSTLTWKDATDGDRYRRGLYTFLKRTSPHPAMTAFDAGSGEVCQIRRVRTNTPLQSLVTLNDPAFLEAAGALAARMTEAGDQLAAQLAHGFQRVLVRKPDQAEIARLIELYQSVAVDLDKVALLATARVKDGDPALIAVANVILNLDETLTKP